MRKTFWAMICLVLMLGIIIASTSYAVQKETTGEKVKGFWKRLFSYPAKVTTESATVTADTGKRGVDVVTSEVKKVGEVTSGEIAKTPELVTEPITGTAETAVKAVEGTVKIPTEAAKEEPPAAENK